MKQTYQNLYQTKLLQNYENGKVDPEVEKIAALTNLIYTEVKNNVIYTPSKDGILTPAIKEVSPMLKEIVENNTIIVSYLEDVVGYETKRNGDVDLTSLKLLLKVAKEIKHAKENDANMESNNNEREL